MSGELYLERNGWKDRLPAALITVLISGAVICLLIPWLMSRNVEGVLLKVSSGILVLVMWWGLYTPIRDWLVKKQPRKPVVWKLTWDSLIVGDTTIALDDIKQVYCWPNRTALGYPAPGWTVNIETKGKNCVLRSSAEQGEQAAELLHEMVAALGYGHRWPEQ